MYSLPKELIPSPHVSPINSLDDEKEDKDGEGLNDTIDMFERMDELANEVQGEILANTNNETAGEESNEDSDEEVDEVVFPDMPPLPPVDENTLVCPPGLSDFDPTQGGGVGGLLSPNLGHVAARAAASIPSPRNLIDAVSEAISGVIVPKTKRRSSRLSKHAEV